MAVKSVKLGPGTLKFGPTTPVQDASSQVQNCVVAFDKDTTDPITVLTGETVAGGTTYTATISGTFVQDLTSAGLVAWSWTNKGTTIAFEFVPNTASAAKVTGTVVIDPIDVGSTEDYGTTMTSDFEWDIVGIPVLAGGTLLMDAESISEPEPVGA